MVIIPPQMKKNSEGKKRIDREILEHTISYITAAFGLVAGLAWNTAVQALIQYAFPVQDQNALWAKFVYAIIITILVTIITIYFTRIVAEKEEESEEEAENQ